MSKLPFQAVPPLGATVAFTPPAGPFSILGEQDRCLALVTSSFKAEGQVFCSLFVIPPGVEPYHEALVPIGEGPRTCEWPVKAQK